MDLKNKLHLVAAIIIGVLSVSTLIYAIVMHETGQTDEPGFMTVCFNHLGLAEYDLQVCAHGGFEEQEIQWSRENIPLTVRTSGEMSSLSLIHAIAQINYQVGCTLFVDSDESESNVVVFPNTPMTSNDHPGGSVIFRIEDGTQRAYLDIYASSSGSNAMSKVYMHELGHVLGLAHDTWQGSIMRRQQNNSVELVRLSDQDRHILNERYCGP